MKKRSNTIYLAEMGVLLAILVMLEVTNLGMIRKPPIELTIMQIPVIIGAIVLGPSGGAVLGGFFGLISLTECLTGKSVFFTPLFVSNPLYMFLVCIPTRILMGWCCGLIFKGLNAKLKDTKANLVSYISASLGGSVLNTILFVGVLLLCFWNHPDIQALATNHKAANPLVFAVIFVGVNGLVEAAVCTVVGTVVSKSVRYALHRNG